MKNWCVPLIIFIMLSTSVSFNFHDSDQINSFDNEQLNDDISKNLKNSMDDHFTLNKGQIQNPEVVFHSQNAYFTPTGVIFRVFGDVEPTITDENFLNPINDTPTPQKMYVYKMNFLGVNQVNPIGVKRMTYNSNFFYGNDSSKWCTDVPNFSEIIYENLYDNIDLLYKVVPEGIKYEFVVYPGGDVKNIQLEYEGAKISSDGEDIFIETSVGIVVDGGLYVYQLVDYEERPVDSRIVVNDNVLEYDVNYNPNYNLIIDPLVYSTYVGGSKDDRASHITSDNQGNAFVTGMTNSTDFPTTPGVYNSTYNGILSKRDVYVFKLNDKGSKLLYSTYIGGSDGVDRGSAIEVDALGNAYVMGDTQSSDFPVTPGAFDTFWNSSTDAFILKLNPNGSKLVYSTFIGGEGQEVCGDMKIDNIGNVYLTGFTNYHDFPLTVGAYDSSFNGFWDCFLLKLNQLGSGVIFSTFFGGTGYDQASVLTIDSLGNVYIAGCTNSSNFPITPNAYDTTYNGDGQNLETDVFVLKFNPTGSKLLYSTFIGADKWDYGLGIAIDDNNNTYITGWTNSSNFPTTMGAYKVNMSGSDDAYVLKLNHNGSQLLYSTFVGGDGMDCGYDIILDLKNNVWVSGATNSANHPTTSNAYDLSYNGNSDIVIFGLNLNTSKLLYSTYLGGSDVDIWGGFEMDCLGNVYITGTTNSSDFPTTPMAFDRTYNGDTGAPSIIRNDIFVVKMKLINVQNEITSIALLKDNKPVTKVYTNYSQYTFRINVSTDYSWENLGSVDLVLRPMGSDIELTWDRSKSLFSEVSDPFNYVTLNSSSSAQKLGLDQWTIYFNLTFNWNYQDENLHDLQVRTISSTLPDAWLNKTAFFCVENDLVFTGNLSITGRNNRTIITGSTVSCGENLTWEGLIPVYEGTTDIYPPDDEFDVTIWDGLGNFWVDSPISGEPFKIETQTPKKPFIYGLNYTINISHIPQECDKSDEKIIIYIDWINITFYNARPDPNIWQTSSNVFVEIVVRNIGFGTVNGSTLMYAVSYNNGLTWSSWESANVSDLMKYIHAGRKILFPDGMNNLVKWQVKDSIGNGPFESDEYKVLVDTKNVTFSMPVPLEHQISSNHLVQVGITISDETSGVDGSSIQYSTSTDNGRTWSKWMAVYGPEYSNNIVNVSLNLTFPNGTGNLIKWRANDIAGNGPTISNKYRIIVNILKNKTIPNVILLEPKNGSTINKTTIKLSWKLFDSNLTNVEYDLVLDTFNPPLTIRESNLSATNFIVSNLTNKITYYWYIIPKIGPVNGSCLFGVWSFTINTNYYLPNVSPLSPLNHETTNMSTITLFWTTFYLGTGQVTYDVYFDTINPPKTIVAENHTDTSFTPETKLEDGKTYYWKIVPKVNDKIGFESEIWTFAVSFDEVIYDLELKLNPSLIEIEPGGSGYTIIKVKNLGTLIDLFTIDINDPTNDQNISYVKSEPDSWEALPDEYIEINLTITIAKSTPALEKEIVIGAISKKAEDNGFNIRKNATLTIRILESKEDVTKKGIQYTWSLYLLLIVIIILLTFLTLKIGKRNVLANIHRKLIYEMIKEKPAIHFREIMRELSLKPGNLSYHLNILEKKGYVKSIQKGVYRCFYPKDAKSDFRIVLSTIQQNILFSINKNPGISLTELSEKLDKNKFMLSYHTKVLQEANIIRKEKEGRIPKYYTTSLATYYLV